MAVEQQTCRRTLTAMEIPSKCLFSYNFVYSQAFLCVYTSYYRFTPKGTSGSKEYNFGINLCFPLAENGNCDNSAVSQARFVLYTVVDSFQCNKPDISSWLAACWFDLSKCPTREGQAWAVHAWQYLLCILVQTFLQLYSMRIYVDFKKDICNRH